MAARLTRLLVALGLLFGGALPSAAAAVVCLPTSHESATSPAPARGIDPANARSYFGARYYRADIGRFTTLDPELNIEGSLVNPQKWNRYAYVLNNPLRYIDKDGREEDAAYSLYLIREQVRKMGGDAAVAQMDRRNAIMGLSITGGLAAGALAAEAAPASMALARLSHG